MNSQLNEVSALFDGELEPHEVVSAIRTAVADGAARNAWASYALIGDHLRGESAIANDMTAAVMARLDDEPVVLAPRNLNRIPRHRPLLALAASVAGVAVVGWLALAGNPRPAAGLAGNLAAVAPAPTLALTRAAPALAKAEGKSSPAPVMYPARSDISEYLLAHQTQSSSFRLGDGTQQVRTVSLVGSPARP